jgi:predicted nucleic acid-binding Zn ribbon protein
MKVSEKHLEWFEFYLSDRMSSKEKSDFELLLSQNIQLRQELLNYQHFLDALNHELLVQSLKFDTSLTKNQKRERLKKVLFLGISVLSLMGALLVLYKFLSA